jgi:16S rRNA (uracil1498-N3)-methyltransferase
MTDRADVEWASGGDASALVFVEAPLQDELAIDGVDGHHLARVLRLEPGERVTVADGAGTWRPFRIHSVANGVVGLRADGASCIEPELVPGLGVAFAVTKGQKPETVVDRLTQLGVDRIVAITTERSIARWTGTQRLAKLDRLQRVAREAAMQCRRARLPEVAIAGALDDVTAHPGLVVADLDGTPADRLPPPGPEGWLVVVGPEGGFSPAEHTALGNAPRLAVGPHVLRAETAAVATAAVLGVPRRSATGHAG